MRQNTVRMLVELEVPDEKGVCPTNGYELWEVRPPLQVGEGTAYIAFYEKRHSKLDEAEQDELTEALLELSRKLRRLPRLTREFLATLIERREERDPRRDSRDFSIHLELNKVVREFHGDVKEELDLLVYEGLVDVDGDDPPELGAPEVFVDLTDCVALRECLVAFIEDRGLNVRQVIGATDLSAF